MTKWIVIAALFIVVLAGIAVVHDVIVEHDYSTDRSFSTVSEMDVDRVWDKDTGIVCYVIAAVSGSGISCIKLR
jgi:hypothetical protein